LVDTDDDDIDDEAQTLWHDGTAFVITFHVSRRRRKMYIGHRRLCVCLSVCVSGCGRMPTLLHGPNLTWGNGKGCHVVVHYWLDLQLCTSFVAMTT